MKEKEQDLRYLVIASAIWAKYGSEPEALLLALEAVGAYYEPKEIVEGE